MDNNTGERYTIPLLDTLYIPGLTKTLWSVTQFAVEGHLVIFGVDSVTIMMNHGQAKELYLVIPHLFYQSTHAVLPFALAATTQMCHAYNSSLITDNSSANDSMDGAATVDPNLDSDIGCATATGSIAEPTHTRASTEPEEVSATHTEEDKH
jgi:hypothetical protein